LLDHFDQRFALLFHLILSLLEHRDSNFGGCALRGGQGSILGIIVGAAILKVLQRMIVFLGFATHWTDAVIGFVLLAAVIADALVKRRRGY
jgi:ribose/xylose/arabinose/galactoside ABC-type transport system permease subunit